MRDPLNSKSVITSPFIQKDIRNAIEITRHNSVNIAIRETPQSTEECLAVGMFVRRININELKIAVVDFEFGREDTAIRVDIMQLQLSSEDGEVSPPRPICLCQETKVCDLFIVFPKAHLA